MKAFEYLGYKKGDLPISEKLSKNIVSLPMHPYLSSERLISLNKLLNNKNEISSNWWGGFYRIKFG